MRVGVVGAGQLARMMIPPAVHLGIELRVLAEAEGMSAALAQEAVGDYRDLETVQAFARTVDVVTFDHEHVPQEVLRALVADGVRVHPGPDALQYAQDKRAMRTQMAALGLPQPEWAPVDTAVDLEAFLAAHGGRAVVKTARGGYDGKGVRVVRGAAEVADWLDAAAAGTGPELLVEELVDFRRELSQLLARSQAGEVALWPLVESIQRDSVCAEVFAPAPSTSDAVLAEAERIGRGVAEGVGVTGVLAVELFETTDGRILINELAMRPHNSGHWTIEGSGTSQFEQHLRAVLGLPLGATDMTAGSVVMVNVLGGPEGATMPDRYPDALAVPGGHIHSYEKESRPGRKVGHVTVCGDNPAEVRSRARRIAAFFTG